MHISRLDLFGFKSFPDRTTFHFGGGVSCVVGPNGSGKSNVVDALRWCIGEQSPRSLRGAEMADVIFAGSQDRRPVGFAEVVLTLVADRDQPFPGEYAALGEIQVGRRLHRTGASEYLINQTRVRRKDVVELLMDSGIANNLYSFIEQGQVDRVITASPEERRAVIDEAAGIARYKARRAEARARLVASASQLDRASDVVEEMSRRLAALEQQVVRAGEFRRRRARIRHAELALALAKSVGLADERRRVEEALRAHVGLEEDKRDQLEQAESELARRREELSVVGGGVTELRERLAELDGRIREHEAARRLHEDRRVELVRENARATEEVSRARVQHDEAVQEARRVEQELRELEARHEALEGRLGEAREAARKAQSASGEATALAEAAQEALTTVSERRLQELALQSALEARRDTLGDRLEGLGRQREAGERALTEASEQAKASAEVLPGLEQAVARAQRAAEQAETRWQGAQAAARSADEELSGALREQQARLEQERARAAEIRRRGQQWADAFVLVEQEAARSLEEHWRAEVQRAEAEALSQVRGAVAETEAGEAEQTEARVREAEQAVEGALAARDALEQAVASAEEAHRQHDETARALAREQAACEARLAAARARLQIDNEVLDGHPPLVELVDPAARPEVLERLGERALLPVVRASEALERAAGAVRPGAWLQAWYRPTGSLPPEASASWASSLGEALSRAARGEAAVGPGFRVSSSGWVELGVTADLRVAAEQARQLEEALSTLASRGEQLGHRREGLAASLAQARAERDLAEQALREAREHAASERREAQEAAAEAVARAEVVARERARARVLERERERDSVLSQAAADRSRRIEAVRAQVEVAIEQLTSSPPSTHGIAAIEGQAGEARHEAQRALAARDRSRGEAVAAEQALTRAQAQVAAAAREMERCQAELGERERERREVAGAREAVDQQRSEVLDSLGALAERETAARTALAERQRVAGLAAAAAQASAKTVSDLKGDLGGLRERAAGLRARQEASVERRASAEGTIDQAQARVAEAREATRAAVESRDAAAVAVEQASVARTEVWDVLQRERARAEGLQQGLARVEGVQEQLRRALEELSAEHEALSAREAEIGQEIRLLGQRMDDRYQVSVSALLHELRRAGSVTLGVDASVAEGIVVGSHTVEPVRPLRLTPEEVIDEAEVARRVRELERDRKQLAALGEVNLTAPDEYRELHGRHEEMRAQQADIEESMRSIRSAIARMNALCTERFTEAFAEVKGHFQATYPRLVGGGSARLELTDEQDVLESGVEIFVQPPGKRLQNLTLLSGGEKAMTAIALLIALFRVKPSPFCVLDEVDAPLDEANGARFNEMLREMSERSQFLVITHNRKTMECADTLYGITMAKPGVSRLVSVRL